MGYTIFLLSKQKPLGERMVRKILKGIPGQHRFAPGQPVSDISFTGDYIRMSGSYGISGDRVEGLAFWLICQFSKKGVMLTPFCIDIDYSAGSVADGKWLAKRRELKDEKRE